MEGGKKKGVKKGGLKKGGLKKEGCEKFYLCGAAPLTPMRMNNIIYYILSVFLNLYKKYNYNLPVPNY
jgi:hypothetical protein